MRILSLEPGRWLAFCVTCAALLAAVQSAAAEGLTLDTFKKAPSKVILADGKTAPADVKLTTDWTGPLCRAKLTNQGKEPVKIKEIVLFELANPYSPDTHLYGEGFTMLAEKCGTIGNPQNMAYNEVSHYKIPQPTDAAVTWGLLTLSPASGEHAVLAFTSCRRFVSRFDTREKSITVTNELEGLTLAPGASFDLEEFSFTSGRDLGALLSAVGDQIAKNHPPLIQKRPEIPTGWCSWYCFGSRVTAKNVVDNMDFISKNKLPLKYIQLDDGYQPAMGDWLETGTSFGGKARDVLLQIKAQGFEPAIWVAPFIAEKGSKLFQEHPDWFIKDDQGQPLSAELVTFRGWRRAPWYALDGTHPEAQKWLEETFRTLRNDWACSYFKLDANFWGTMHGGHFYDPNATRVDAYRRGMEAVIRGAGDGFILGCNHPIWPSLGVIHGSRSSNDIKRTWDRFEQTARMNLSRNWQNGRLWWNDPDCICLTGDLTEDEYQFHATAIYASGGMLLSGDDLTKISEPRLAMLRKVQQPTGVAAEFADDTLQVGYVKLKDRTLACVFNWDKMNTAQPDAGAAASASKSGDPDKPLTVTVNVPGKCRVTDFWTGEVLGMHEGKLEVKDVPVHGARLLVLEPAK